MSKTEQKPEIICQCEIHPAASIFPLMEGDRFQSLVDSIQVHGLQNPIVCSGNVVLDGRNRLRAVEKLRNEGHQVELLAVQWDCGDKCMTPAEWITAQNLDRRHLSEDAYVAAQAALSRILRKEAKERQTAGLKKGTENPVATKTSPRQKRDAKTKDAESTAGKVAAKAGVSLHKAKQALKLDKAVEEGSVPVEVQREVIAGMRKLKDAVAIAEASKERRYTLADIDPLAAVLREQRDQRKKRGPTKQSENARLERKLTKLMIDIRRTVEKLADNTSNKSSRRKGVADELRRLADLLLRDEVNAG